MLAEPRHRARAHRGRTGASSVAYLRLPRAHLHRKVSSYKIDMPACSMRNDIWWSATPRSMEDVIEQPVEVNGLIVGYFRINASSELTEELDLGFASQQSRSMYLIFAVGLVLSALCALWLARHLVAPIRVLATGARRLAKGDYGERITVPSRDEIGQLATDFNALATTLESNRAARRAFFADISHELRTPLTIINGEIQALQDGVRKLDADSLESLSDEVSRLSKLVDDIYQLALSDASAFTYQMSALDVAPLITDIVAAFESRIEAAGLSIEMRLDRSVSAVLGDRERLIQLITNLVENSMRYTASGGTIRIFSEQAAGAVQITIDDSEPAPQVDDFEQLFEPLFREDRSRSRETGGAGLGLSIARKIAQAHQGSIDAGLSPLGGLRVRLRLPVDDRGRE